MIDPATFVGRTFGKGAYEIRQKLGEGGMGVVFRAWDAEAGRDVAVKFLRTDGPVDPETISRFKNEGRKYGTLRHPNLVRVYALGKEEGLLYIASEFVEGKNLYQLLVKGAVPVDRALSIVQDAARGLAVAHGKMFVHRDLKPENIMVRDADGQVKVLDFGIAKDLNASIALTVAGHYIGTPAYSAPEQIRGEPVDRRADIFALGVILYELLTGKVAFGGRNTVEILQRTRREAPTPANKLNAEVSGPVARLIDRMIMKSPAKRPDSCEEVVEEIDRIRAQLATGVSDEDERGIRGFLKRLFGDED
ncbi:MAG TPA: serine/threonine-protein kinase [Planctomycetota bacterium]|nr:serine/threonine-protein kinase [Planctomycetota bacterium]